MQIFTNSILSFMLWSVAEAQLSWNSSAAFIAARTCQELQSTLGPAIVQDRKSGPQYAIGANAAWNAFNTEINFQPTCIVFVKKTEDVQVVMKTIFDNEADYAVQAGGHSAMKGWNTVENGVLISFLFMNDTSYDPDTDTITLLPGIRWGQAVSTLEPFGVAPVGGRVDDVGTGLLLGGGLSYLSPAFGYAADTFVSLDVVLVNGTLVTATVDNEYADLFKALKGGVNRFDIVTRYEVQAVHTGRAEEKRWWGGELFYSNSSAEALLSATAHFAHDVNDPNAACFSFFAVGFGNDSDVFAENGVWLFYNGSSASFNETFSEFLSIPSIGGSLGPLSYLDVTQADVDTLTGGQLYGAAVLTGIPAESDSSSSQTTSSQNSYIETLRLFNNFTVSIADSGQLIGAALAFTPIIENQIRVGLARGGNAIDAPLANGGFNAVQFTAMFVESVTDIPEDIEQARDFFFRTVPNTPGLPLYINECDANQHVFKTYGGYQFLKEVYAKYDPTRFNVRHTQGPFGL